MAVYPSRFFPQTGVSAPSTQSSPSQPGLPSSSFLPNVGFGSNAYIPPSVTSGGGTSAGGGASGGGGGTTTAPTEPGQVAPPTAEEIAAATVAEQERVARENRRTFAQTAATQYPWLSSSLISVFIDSYVEHGDTFLALNEIRNGKGKTEYDTIFAGNRREDGTLRYSENEYFAVKNTFRASLQERGLNPDLFEGRYADLIANDVSPQEFESRVTAVEEQVVFGGEFILRAFTEAAGVEFTPEAAFASLLDPDVGDGLLKRNISIAEVRGEAARFGFSRSIGRGEELVTAGVGRQQASQFFSQAGQQVGAFNRFAEQFGAPDPTVDITELESAALLNDPFQRARLQRLQRQAAAQFSPSVGVAGSRLGTLGGLVNR